MKPCPLEHSGFFCAAPSRLISSLICAALITLIFICCSSNEARGCTDILNAFLSAEKLNDVVRESLVKINVGFQKLDVAMTQDNLAESKALISNLIESYFDFYFKYYQDPPVQFLDDPKWHDKLSEVNGRLKVMLKLINENNLKDAHENTKLAYEAFSAIYKDRIPMQEQNVLDMITNKLKTMNEAMDEFLKTGTSEVSVHANNLKGLAERLAGFDSSNEAYLAERKGFTNFLTDKSTYFVKNPITDSAACELQRKELTALTGTVESFISKRKNLLNREWFDGKK